MRLAALFSGGKDSARALELAMVAGHEIVCLVTVISESRESYMYHVPAIGLTEMMAEAAGFPRMVVHTAGEKEKELAPLSAALRGMRDGDYGIEGIVSGAIRSEYQRSRLAGICDELGLESLTPLWHTGTDDFLAELVSAGYEIMISGVFAHGLDESFLGRTIDVKIMERIRGLNEKYGVSMVGEGGEFETSVLDSPFYGKKIVVDELGIVWERDSGYVVVKGAHLEEKR